MAAERGLRVCTSQQECMSDSLLGLPVKGICPISYVHCSPRTTRINQEEAELLQPSLQVNPVSKSALGPWWFLFSSPYMGTSTHRRQWKINGEASQRHRFFVCIESMATHNNQPNKHTKGLLAVWIILEFKRSWTQNEIPMLQNFDGLLVFISAACRCCSR